MQHIILQLADEEATQKLGAQLATSVAGGMVITLAGELGAGKTTLVRALLRALGESGPVKSPSYALVEEYRFAHLYFYHFDFYRLRDPSEWDESGFSEYFRADSLCVIEWVEKAGGRAPSPDLALTLTIPEQQPTARTLTLNAFTEAGQRCLQQIAAVSL